MLFTSILIVLYVQFTFAQTNHPLPYPIKCFYINNHNAYSFSSLSSHLTPKFNITIRHSLSKKDYILFNFCDFIYHNNTNTNTTFRYYSSLTNTFYNISSSTTSKQLTHISAKSLLLTFSQGDTCLSNPSLNYTIHFNLTCDNTLPQGKPLFNVDSFNINTCTNTISGKSKETCPLTNYYTLNAFIDSYTPLIITIYLIISIYLLIFGGKFFEVTGELIGIIVFMTVLLLNIYTTAIINGGKITTVWFICVVGLVFGSLFSLLISKATKINHLVLVILMGYYIAHGVFYVLFLLIYQVKGMEVVFWGNLCLWVSVALGVAFKVGSWVYYVGCSVVGGFFLIKGIALMMGKTYNVMKILDLYANEEWEQVEEYRREMKGIWYLVIVWGVVSVGGVYAQKVFNVIRDKKKKNDFLEIDKYIDNKSLI